MKIVYIPQLSMVNKITTRFDIEKDSNFTFSRLVITELQKTFENCKIKILLPNCIEEEPILENCEIIRMTSPNSAMSMRYVFNYYDICQVLLEDPDLIINDIIELSRNLSVICNHMNINPKIVSSIKFIDFPSERKINPKHSFFLRQIDGCLSSDLTVFLTENVKDQFIEEASRIVPEIKQANLSVWPAFLDFKEFNPNYSKANHDKKRVAFLGRITENAKEYSNWRLFLKAAEILSSMRNDIEIIVTNPSRYKTHLINEHECIKQIHLPSRADYLDFLLSLSVSCNLRIIEGTGGMAIRESIAAAAMPVIFDVPAFQKIIPKEYPGLIRDKTPEEVAKAISRVLDLDMDTSVFWFFEIYDRLEIETDLTIIRKDLWKLLKCKK